MQSDLRRTIEAYGDDAGSGTRGGIAGHVAVAPGSGSHPPRQHRVECQRYCPRQADLASVRMSAQEQIKAGMGGLSEDFGRMRQQDGKCSLGNLRPGFFNIVDPEVMRIVDSGEVYCLIAAFDYLAFVLQHSYAHGLQPWQHLDSVVITEHTKDRLLQVAHHSCHARQRSIVRAESLAAIVACQ